MVLTSKSFTLFKDRKNYYTSPLITVRFRSQIQVKLLFYQLESIVFTFFLINVYTRVFHTIPNRPVRTGQEPTRFSHEKQFGPPDRPKPTRIGLKRYSSGPNYAFWPDSVWFGPSSGRTLQQKVGEEVLSLFYKVWYGSRYSNIPYHTSQRPIWILVLLQRSLVYTMIHDLYLYQRGLPFQNLNSLLQLEEVYFFLKQLEFYIKIKFIIQLYLDSHINFLSNHYI